MRLRERLRGRVFGNRLGSTSRHVGCRGGGVLCMPFEVVGLVVVVVVGLVGLVGLVGGIGGCVVVGKGEEAIAAVAVEDTVAVAAEDVAAEDRSDAVVGAEESDGVEDAAAVESKAAAVAGAVGQGYEEELGQSV